jgi:hypothetical protein
MKLTTAIFPVITDRVSTARPAVSRRVKAPTRRIAGSS